MNYSKYISKVLVAMVLVMVLQVAIAASSSVTTGTTEKSKSKFTLKNLNKNLSKSNLGFTLRAQLPLTGTQIMSVQKKPNSVQYNSIIRYDKGNTSYIFPYKVKVHVPKFKTPTAPLQ